MYTDTRLTLFICWYCDESRENEESAVDTYSLRKALDYLGVLLLKPKSNTPLMSRQFGQHSTLHRIRTSSDQSECTVAAIEVLANGNIIVADTNNSKLKLFTGQFDFLDETSLPGKPVDMCFNQNKVYFCCSYIKKIFWLEFAEGMFSQACRSFDTRLQPISVSKFESSVLVLFSSADYDGNEAGVVNIELRKGNGAILSQITYDSSDPHMQYIEHAKRIHVTPSSEILMAQTME